MNTILKNEHVELIFDESGTLLSFRSATGETLFKEHSLCRLILGTPHYDEFEARPEGAPEIRNHPESKSVSFAWTRVRAENLETYPIALTLEISLEGNLVHWGRRLSNGSEDATVREVHYPLLRVAAPADTALTTGDYMSMHYENLASYVDEAFTSYVASDQKYVRRTSEYPGFGPVTSVNFRLLEGKNIVCYFGCHDSGFRITGHSAEREAATREIVCFTERYPFLKPGDSCAEDNIVTAFVPSWTDGCALYRAWADSWYRPVPLPEHTRRLAGWQRIIMHHQFGEYYFRYHDLVKMYEDGRKAGLDTLFLFGWTSEGMDAGYPAFTPDESQGGFEALRENIAKVRALGGHVILYFNGQLIDQTSEFYRSGAGKRICVKNGNGTEHVEAYNFSNTGSFIRQFGNRTFVVACPSSPEWKSILKEHIDFTAAVGADTVFFDQMGLATIPCCDPGHGHEVPFTGMMNGKAALMAELRAYATERGLGFMTECVTDVIANTVDLVHLVGSVAEVWNPDWRDKNEVPRFLSEHNLFRQTFPETPVTNRNLRDGNNVLFQVNRLAVLGLRTDCEVYRCRATIAEIPEYQAYLGKVNALRAKYAAVLFDGTYAGPLHHLVSNPRIQSSAFLGKNKIAIAACQSFRETQTAEISVPGYRFIEFSSARGDAEFDGKTLVLPPDSLAVLLFEKNL